MKRCHLCLFFIVIELLLTGNTFAQKAKGHALTADEAKIVKKDAAFFYSSENYNAALPGYIELQKSSPDNPEYNYRLGICYLQTVSDHALAVAPLEIASKSKEPKKDTWYYLGLAYMHANRFDEAKAAFSHAASVSGFKLPKDSPSMERLIELCDNGKSLVAAPVDVTFSNMGAMINSIYDDYNPMISADGKQLVFSTRRKGNLGGYIEDLGMYSADIYWSTWKDTAWIKAKGIGGMVNTDWDEECVSVSADGSQIFVFFDNAEYFGDIGRTTLKGKMWQKPEMMDQGMNSKGIESGACMSLDGKTVIFSSVRKENSMGGSDLYMIRRESSGSWSDPVNLGPNINTAYDEESPALSLDGKQLYFSSKGWNTMGGFDIFMSVYDEGSSSWSKPVNVGYPINTADDNAFFSLSGDGRAMYVSAVRPEGLGQHDIYKVTFNDTASRNIYTVINGTVNSLTTGKPELTRISLVDKDNHTILEYKPLSPTNRFVLIARPGVYTIRIEGYHFEPVHEPLEISSGNAETLEKVISVSLAK